MDRSRTYLPPPWLTGDVNQDRADQPGRWTRLTSTSLFSSKWLELRRDEAVRPDGSVGEYDHVLVPGSVTVVAVDDRGQVAVTRQWIYVHQDTQWRLPAGQIDSSDSDPEASARRELAEEAGISADRWTRLGVINCADSFSNHRDFAFLATGLHIGPARFEPYR